MNTILLKGIDGDSPLGFMAAMGAFRVATMKDPTAKMRWEISETSSHPLISTTLSADALMTVIRLETLGIAGFPIDYDKQISSLQKNIEKLKKKKAKGQKELEEFFLDPLNDIAIWQEEKSLVSGVEKRQSIFYGDVIKTTTEAYRASASDAIPDIGMPASQSISDFFAAFASDAIHKDEKNNDVMETLLSFSNNSSGQCLFKDYKSLLQVFTIPMLTSSLIDAQPILLENITSLNWSPEALRVHSLRWYDPQDKKSAPTMTDTAMYATAFLGLATLPSMPGNKTLYTMGFHSSRKNEFIWPIWEHSIALPVVQSLLLTPVKNAPCSHWYCCHRYINDKGRPFFLPAVPL
ncbi:MAG: hypothetical protein MJ202_00015 [Lentisphaeria bacterium]|nr:hypothetical protein [Lentisphaeria bacterium]